MLFCFFFFEQKTAYEMRISDWSSAVCSSDLLQFRSIDDVDLGRPVAILFRDRWKERRDSHAMEVDARAEMPVKIVAIDADADAVLLDDRLCALQPVLAE